MRDAMIGYGHNMTYSKFRYGGSAVQVTEDDGLYLIHFYLLIVCQAIFVDPKTGKIEANADYRKRGTVDGF